MPTASFVPMAQVLVPGQRGNVTVDTFEITPDTFQGFNVERTRPGTYARLMINGAVVMSDTDYELRTNRQAIWDAKGDVLIGGLGIGCITLPICRKPDVRSVTVVEKNADVIALVEEPLRRALTGNESAGLLIWHADIHQWKPIKANVHRFDYIYFDIWTDSCTDSVDEMIKLHRRFQPYLRKGGKVTSWQYDHLRYLRRAGRWR